MNKIRNFSHYRHNQQLEELNVQHQEEIDRLQEQLRRERARGHEDRLHYENEANQVRRIAQERAAAEIERIREEEETKRKVLAKKHAVSEFSTKAFVCIFIGVCVLLVISSCFFKCCQL